MDVTSHTDAFVAIFVQDQQIALTSVIKDTENPTWPDLITIDYKFETTQKITIKIFDQDAGAPPTDLRRHSLIGELSFPLPHLMRAPGQRISQQLTNNTRTFSSSNAGIVNVRAEPVSSTRDIFVANFSAKKLANKDGFFNSSDPFLIISRCNEDGSFTQCWRNEPIKNNLSPVWPLARIPLVNLCNGDLDRPLKIEVWDDESSGRHQTMGVVQTSVRALVDGHGAPMDVVETIKGQKKNSGQFIAANCIVEHHPTFSEYVVGGAEISLIVAVDYTGSNGDPATPASLHHIDLSGATSNQYQQTIATIGQVVEQYDSDKRFPVVGFGARVRIPGGFSDVQHCFQVGANAEVTGVGELLEVYKQSFPNVALSGPTLFAPTIGMAAARAAAAGCSQGSQKYTVLLIIADGIINDEQATIAALVQASHTPLSVVVIGVGAADFTDMKILDGDGAKGPLKTSGGATSSRDILQFVAFRDFAARGPAAVAEQVLHEVPQQFLAFMKQRNILPNPPPPYHA